jgi:hypothetical protein
MSRRVRSSTPLHRRVLAAVGQLLAAALFVRLALWQGERARSQDSPLSWAYAVEWLLLALAVLVAPAVLARRAGRRSPDAAARTIDGRLLGPPLLDGEQLGEPTGVRVMRRLRRRGC